MSPFKDPRNNWRTKGLFLEMCYEEGVIFTLGDKDRTWKGHKLISLKRLYMETNDPTEYTLATQHLGGWAHWKRMRGNKALAKHFDEWQEELAIKLASEGVKLTIGLAKEGGTFQAVKWLADGGWIQKKAGRPSKDAIEGELKKQAKDQDEFAEDLLRLVK